MTKAEKIKMNEEVAVVADALLYRIRTNGTTKLRQLRSCSATVHTCDEFIVLRSYSTYIAAIDTNTGVCYDFLRLVYGYTSTSAQHTAKFYHDYGATKKLTYYPV